MPIGLPNQQLHDPATRPSYTMSQLHDILAFAQTPGLLTMSGGAQISSAMCQQLMPVSNMFVGNVWMSNAKGVQGNCSKLARGQELQAPNGCLIGDDAASRNAFLSADQGSFQSNSGVHSNTSSHAPANSPADLACANTGFEARRVDVSNTACANKIFPRRKAGQSFRINSKPVVLTEKVLRQFFDLPLHEAAISLGISATAMKSACRLVAWSNQMSTCSECQELTVFGWVEIIMHRCTHFFSKGWCSKC